MGILRTTLARTDILCHELTVLFGFYHGKLGGWELIDGLCAGPFYPFLCGTSTLSKATYTRSSLFPTYTCSSGDEENGCRAMEGIANNEPRVPGGQDVSLTAQWPALNSAG